MKEKEKIRDEEKIVLDIQDYLLDIQRKNRDGTSILQEHFLPVGQTDLKMLQRLFAYMREMGITSEA